MATIINPGTDQKITYVVDDILDGFNKAEKLPQILEDLKNYLFLEGPLFFSENRLITLSGDGNKQGDYLLEVYKVKNSNQMVFLEFYGDLKATEIKTNRELKQQSSPMQPNKWHHLVISIIPRNIHIKKVVEEVLKKYHSY
ncbi:MAG: hypothetical protein ACOCXG_02355 [Nanoarchaeota archaeon]